LGKEKIRVVKQRRLSRMVNFNRRDNSAE